MELKIDEYITQIQLGIWDSDTPFIVALTNKGRLIEKGNVDYAQWKEIELPPQQRAEDLKF